MQNISHLALTDNTGIAEVQADPNGEMAAPVSLRFHSPATHHPYLTPSEARWLALSLLSAAEVAEGRQPTAVSLIDAMARAVYHPGGMPSVPGMGTSMALAESTAAALDLLHGSASINGSEGNTRNPEACDLHLVVACSACIGPQRWAAYLASHKADV